MSLSHPLQGRELLQTYVKRHWWKQFYAQWYERQSCFAGLYGDLVWSMSSSYAESSKTLWRYGRSDRNDLDINRPVIRLTRNVITLERTMERRLGSCERHCQSSASEAILDTHHTYIRHHRPEWKHPIPSYWERIIKFIEKGNYISLRNIARPFINTGVLARAPLLDSRTRRSYDNNHQCE